MASITTGGITTTSKNICIPLANAGIGDAIAIQSGTSGTSPSHFVAVVGKSVQSTPPTGYVWYGTVYGREKGGLMIRSFAPTTAKWASTTAAGVVVTLNSTKHASVIANTMSSAGLMRNGLAPYNGIYAGMSVGEIISRNSGSTTTHLHPNSPYYNNREYPMGKTNFELDVNGAKTMYGTYENYIAQLLPLMKGSKSGVFSKRCGMANTKELADNNSTEGYSFPAASYCRNLQIGSEGAYHWWLPDMYELAVMMSDNSFERCQHAHSVIGGNTERSANRWSSVRYGSTAAWIYRYNGFSDLPNFLDGLTVVPVTLLAL